MHVIEINNVSKKFREKGKDVYAVRDVSFNVRKGEIFGLLGPNGAGKTTLLNMLIGLLTPDEGYVRIYGKDIIENRKLLEDISFVSGFTRFHWVLRLKDILKFYSMVYGIPKRQREKKISRLVKFFDIEHLMNKRFDYLSTGERMRLIFTKALLNDPKILLLDEPTLGLDPDIAIKTRNEIKRINKKFKTTILLTSHYMHEVEQLSQRLAFMDKGRIIDIGSVKDVKIKKFDTYDAIIKVANVKNPAFLRRNGFRIKGNTLYKTIPIDKNISEIVSLLTQKNYDILNIETKKPTLEDYFVKISRGK